MTKTASGRTAGNNLEPLAVSPKQACLLLGVGTTRLYQLLASGELASYHEGRARRITMASIRSHVARLAGAGGNGTATQTAPRRRGRPGKQSANEATAGA